MRNRTTRVNRGGTNRSISRLKRLCVNPDCQRGVPLDQVQNLIDVFDEEIDPGLRKKALMRPNSPVFVCCICGNLSHGRINTEGDPLPITHLRLFRDPNSGTVVYYRAPDAHELLP
jgi:hypothetical protein